MSLPKIRKSNTAARKKARKEAQKEAQERLQKTTAAFLDHPTECCLCKASFVRNKKTVKTWHVVVNEDRVRLTCPECWGLIAKLVEKEE